MNSGQVSRWLPYCGPGPDPSHWLDRWNFDPMLLIAMGGVAIILWHMGSERRLLYSACALSLLLFVSPFCALSSALFSVRVTHHVLIAALLASLLVWGLPVARLRWLGSLGVWTVLQTLTFWFWHAPDFYAWALSSDWVFWFMQLTLLGAAMGFWATLRRAQAPAAIAALLFSTVQMGLLGALIVFSPNALYAPHYLTTALWGFSVLEDQQLAGLIMWVPAAAFYLGSALLVASRWLRREDLGLVQ